MTQANQKNLLWSLLTIYAISIFLFPFLPISPEVTAAILVILTSIFAIVHSTIRYGIRTTFIFISICFIISNILENISIQTGFPFGHYHYTDLLGPKIFAVPILISPAYFSTGYLSWTVANVLLDKVEKKLNKFNLISLPVIAAFIMTMWDIVIDPTMATIQQNWIWHDGGGFFGVPLSNYLGWFLTVYLFFQAFALYMKKNNQKIQSPLPGSYWLQAVLFYLLIGQVFLIDFFIGTNGKVIDATGQIWDKHAIRETSVILSIYTMSFVVVLALIRLKNTQT